MINLKSLFKFGGQGNNKSTKISKDPVCGMRMTDGITCVYKNQSYFFCSDHCREQFEKEPERYIVGK